MSGKETIQNYLKEIDRVIQNGPYQDNWASLVGYPEPTWYKNAKFGIFIHWGVYSVPAFNNEWYSREMYVKGHPCFDHHIKTYGSQKEFGYKDFIPLFRGEKFDADAWLDLFEKAGAKYIMPVAEHHDGFQMYNSALSRWNATQMGPKRDVLGELKAAAEKRKITFCTSSHRAEHFWFFSGGKQFDSDVQDPAYADLYGDAVDGIVDVTLDITSKQPTRGFLDEWLVRTCELIDRYQPGSVYFDWWIHNLGFKPYLKKFAAYYYNRAHEWGREVAINYKHEAFARTAAVYDVERGQLDDIYPHLWQTDTAIGYRSWGYTKDNVFKKPEDLVCDLVDIVSKNGCLLLNVGPKPDGTITQEETNVLLSIGRWMEKNSEGIYGSTFWRTYGEGPTKVPKGTFTDDKKPPFTSEDIRYTYKDGNVYAFVMKYPENGQARLTEFRWNRNYAGDVDVKKITVLESGEAAAFTRDDTAMTVKFTPNPAFFGYPLCLKIEID